MVGDNKNEDSGNRTKDSNEKYYFQEIKNPADIEKAILELVADKSDLHTWKKGQEILESYVVKGYQSDIRAITMGLSGNFISSIIGSQLLNNLLLFKAATGKYIYFGSGTLTRDAKTRDYQMCWVEPFFQSQQRSNYRISYGQENIIKIEINKEIFNAVDLSAGGASIAVPKSRSVQFACNKTFLKVKITFNTMSFEVPKMETRAHIPFLYPNNDEGIQVGMAFYGLDKILEHDLARYINSRARYSEIRKSISDS